MNSKKLGILVVLLALLTVLFVSCNSEVTDTTAANAGNELVYATFDNNSKNVVVNSVVGYKTYNELYWFYTAQKTDEFGRTGQTDELTPVSREGNSPNGAHVPGLSGKVGPFSQGTWSFTLYAYEDANKTTLYYQGSTSSDVTLRNGVDNYIPVTVTPQGDYGSIAFYNGTNTTDTYFVWAEAGGGDGALRLDITLKDSNNVVYNCVSKNLTKGTDNKYKIDGRISKTATDDKFAVGVYTATFKVVNPSDSSVVFTSQDLSLRVYGNLTTQLKGSLTEIVEAYGYFQVPEQQINVFIATAAEVTQTVNVAPEKYVDPTAATPVQQTTTVKFEATALDTTNSQHTLKVEVTPIATAATKFEVIGEETAVAGIDFELKKIVTETVGDVTTTTEQTVTSFENQKYATIETYIAKGFNTVTVVYTGTELAQPIANELETPTNVATVYANDAAMGTHLGYSKDTGLLRFKTNHFSEYYVKASVEAINVTTNTVYTTLAEAVDAVKDNETIQLIKNVKITDKLIVGSDTDSKSFVLDLNEKTLYGRINLVHGNLTIKNGTIAGSFEMNNEMLHKQPLNVYGSSSSDAVNYSVLTVESNVTVTGNEFAVCLFGKTYDDANGYGAVVNFYGKASTTGTGKEGAIFVSGNLGQNVGGLAEQNNIINIYGSVISEKDTALALNGNALVNIYEGAELTGNTAVTVKRGKLVVNGGTITSTGAKAYPPEGNNNGTEMTGAGVSVTKTYNSYGPLAVEISGGLITSANADAVYRAAQTYTNSATVSITGGTFSSDPSAVVVDTEHPDQKDDYVAAGYESKQIGDNLWTVSKIDRTAESVAAVIKADDTVLYFSTLADAVDAAEEGETIRLLKDLEFNNASQSKTIFYDLNGHKFTDCPETTLNGNLFAVGRFSGGAGTETSPYAIANGNQWYNLLNYYSGYYMGYSTSGLYVELIGDVDITGHDISEFNSYPRNFHLNGNGFTMKNFVTSIWGDDGTLYNTNSFTNLKLDNCHSPNNSLFGGTQNSDTASVTFTDVDLNNCSAVGGAYQYYDGSATATFINCDVTNTAVRGDYMASGGFVGNISTGKIVIDTCSFGGSVVSTQSACGGFVGQSANYITKNVTIKDSTIIEGTVIRNVAGGSVAAFDAQNGNVDYAQFNNTFYGTLETVGKANKQGTNATTQTYVPICQASDFVLNSTEGTLTYIGSAELGKIKVQVYVIDDYILSGTHFGGYNWYVCDPIVANGIKSGSVISGIPVITDFYNVVSSTETPVGLQTTDTTHVDEIYNGVFYFDAQTYSWGHYLLNGTYKDGHAVNPTSLNVNIKITVYDGSNALIGVLSGTTLTYAVDLTNHVN